MHRCLTGSTGAEGIFSWTLTSLHRWYAPMPHRLNRCWRHFSWALDIISGTKDGQCTDGMLRCTIGSTGAYRLTWLRFPSAPKYHGVGSSDNHRMHRCPCVGSSGLILPIFSLSSFEPKSLRMIILTIILVQVLCVINRQNNILKYGMRDHFQ